MSSRRVEPRCPAEDADGNDVIGIVSAADGCPVKVLMDAHSVGSQATGNETWARNVAVALAARAEARGVVLAVAATRRGAPALREMGIESSRVSDNSAGRLVVGLPLLARRERAAALLVQYTVPLTRRPCVLMVHDLSFEDAEARSWIPAHSLLRYRATVRPSCRLAAAIVVPSEATQRDVISRYGVAPERVTVAYNAVDRALAPALTAVPVRNPVPPYRVLIVGTLLPRKNHVVVARAVRLVRDRGIDVSLRVVGPDSGRGAPTRRQLVALLGESVGFSGYVNNAQLVAEYAAADALAYPSWYEGFGLPVVEAMSCGLPVIVSDRGSLPEIAGDAAPALPPDDPAVWADAIESVCLDGPRRCSLVSAGRARALAFDWDVTAGLLLDLLVAVGEPYVGSLEDRPVLNER